MESYDQCLHALLAEPLQAGFIERGADDRRRIELEIAGVEDEALRRAQRDRAHLGNGMRERDELHVEGSELEAGIELHDVDRDLQIAAPLGELGAQHAGRERRRVDGRLEARPQLDHRADVVLVRVRDEDADEIAAVLLDEAHVGQDHVDAGVELALGEGDPAIDHEPLARIRRPVAIEVEVHADLAEAAKAHEHELVPPPARTGPLIDHRPSFFCSAAELSGSPIITSP